MVIFPLGMWSLNGKYRNFHLLADSLRSSSQYTKILFIVSRYLVGRVELESSNNHVDVVGEDKAASGFVNCI